MSHTPRDKSPTRGSENSLDSNKNSIIFRESSSCSGPARIAGGASPCPGAQGMTRSLFTLVVSYVQPQEFERFAWSQWEAEGPSPNSSKLRTQSPVWSRRRSRRPEGLGDRATPLPRESPAALERREQSKQRTFYEDFTAAVIPEFSLPLGNQSGVLLQELQNEGEPSSQIWILAFPPVTAVRDFISAARAAPRPD